MPASTLKKKTLIIQLTRVERVVVISFLFDVELSTTLLFEDCE